MLWLKSTGIVKEQTRIPLELKIEKNSCRQKRTTIEQYLQISVHTDMKSTKEAIFQQKTPLLESNCKRFRQSAIRENFNLKLDTAENTLSNNGGNYTHQYHEVKEKLYQVSFIYV